MSDMHYLLCQYAGTPARTEGRGARFLLRAHYKHLCTKIIKSLERAGGAAAPQRRRPCQYVCFLGVTGEPPAPFRSACMNLKTDVVKVTSALFDSMILLDSTYC